ncbi:MAG: dienelactone hydrolase family protein [Bacteroidetes bacterium]|nr:dienelactone hydrolase family protein [Bacteroidota bacterium]
MKQNYVSLPVMDGTNMNAYTSFPKNNPGSFPGIILFQEAFGINHHIRNVADRLAIHGYTVIAPELFHRTAPGFEGDYNDFGSTMMHIKALTTDGLEADIKACFSWLQQQPNVIKEKIGSIGFCMGGRISFLANMILPLSAAVSYYSGGMPSLTGRLREIHAPHLMFWGGMDAHIPNEHIEGVVHALKEAKKEYINVVISYADHAFNCDERASYHPQAAKEAWSMTLSFLENKLK